LEMCLTRVTVCGVSGSALNKANRPLTAPLHTRILL
jgi:hypothetical protein